MWCERIKDRLEGLRREVAALGPCGPAAAGLGPPLRDPEDIEAFLRAGFHECLGEGVGDHAAALAFALSGARAAREARGGPVLFCALRGSRQEAGQLYAPGVLAHGLGPRDLLCVSVARETELYWAAEESLAARGLAAIVLDGGGQERRYDFTISRRLKLRVERSAVPLFLVRPWRGEGASAATARWRVARLPSLPEAIEASRQPLVGRPRFCLRLERGPTLHHRSWEFAYDTSGRFRLAAPLADGPADSRPHRQAGAKAA